MRIPSLLLAALLMAGAHAQVMDKAKKTFTHADTLRGTIGPDRAWWNVTYYDVSVRPDIAKRSIQGVTAIAFVATAPGHRMQVDLQQPLVVDSVTWEVQAYRNGALAIEDRPLRFDREGNIILVHLTDTLATGEANTLRVHYHGIPRSAKNPPWDGGWIWKKDRLGNPWVSVACQGLGASAWYPCKDHQSDEPDNGAALHITVPDTLVAVGNGRLSSTVKNNDGTSNWHWSVSSPINNYNLVPYIGKYTHFSEVHDGVSGDLDCDYWVLEQDLEKAREQFKQVGPMLTCFERMMGPFPWYKDGYKLVQAPHLGMEHQSAVAYGNGFVNGYLGMDLSGSGWGNKFDYILVHESGHEWFGNSITTADIADMWVQEGFTMYSEVLYVECRFGQAAATDYVEGIRRSIGNDRPVIGPYGVNEEGSGDMYAKGANVVHMVRQLIGEDRFLQVLPDMQRKYRHAIVTSAGIEAYLDSCTEVDLRPLFDQYLRTTKVPVLEWGVAGQQLVARWTNCNAGFHMPVLLSVNGKPMQVDIGTDWRLLATGKLKKARVEVDRNWYATAQPAPEDVLKALAPLRVASPELQ
ncbi:MAG: M1 family metallopeptidase [Flavobacteriales bacterium]|nr:M1 family metallopeptidase [Flavobacteriales bacterium]